MESSTQPTPAQLPAVPPSTDPAQLNNAVPAVADDGDLIEKEWVAQVKKVVAQTEQNPFELNRQFGALKADYMQKRYGKTIKLQD